MAFLPNPTQVSGKHNAIYEAYYKQVDAKGIGVIEAMDAAKFLKKSGLSDVVLSRIWDLSDPNGRGFLDKGGLYVALKLVSLAQAGHDISLRNIYMETNPPKVGAVPKIMPPSIQSIPPINADWSMKPADRLKYEQLFEASQPSINGLISGNKVKGILLESKLPLDTLGKIWDLADQDKDGCLDKHEFTVAMHLVYQALAKRAVPASLPTELQKPKHISEMDNIDDGGFVAHFPKEMAPPPVPPLPIAMPPVLPPMPRVPPTIPMAPNLSNVSLLTSVEPIIKPTIDWVVPQQDKARYDILFTNSDLDMDGLVSGSEIRDIFLRSGVPQACLAHIWNLCDTNSWGQLTSEQFALAMWFVERQKEGIEPPQKLAPNMIPPSLRSGVGVDMMQQVEVQPTYNNPELDMISKEIEELAKERRMLETDIAQKEADVRIKSGEVRSLQSELDTLAATLKQLENQKGEAQKRLDDLKNQKKDVDEALVNVNEEILNTREQVNKIREQCQKQETTIQEQEGELNSKRSELQKLKDEEHGLEKQYDDGLKELDNLTKKLQDTQLQISQIKAMVSQLQECQRQMSDALIMCKAAIEENDPTLVSDYSLKLGPDFRDAHLTLDDKDEEDTIKNDPFKDEHNTNNNSNTFGNESFSTDPFKSNGFSSDPFSASAKPAQKTGFDDSFGNATGGFDDAFEGNAFANKTADPFAAASGGHTNDPFDEKKITENNVKDDFGSDPFAILHAPVSSSQILSPNHGQKSTGGPPPRPESPSPALPPKKAKQPPPRPAPPRPLQGPTPTRPNPPTDGFGESSAGNPGGFANFADFDNKKVADDFSEDPFKDYRYEDPFNINDPFGDEDDDDDDDSDVVVDAKVDPNSLFSDKNNKLSSFNNNKNKNNNQTIINDDEFNNKLLLNKNIINNNLVLSNNNNNINLFENDIKLISNNHNNNNINNDNFANFDAFNDDSSETTISSQTLSSSLKLDNNNIIINNSNNNSNNDFFSVFNDNFNKNLQISNAPSTATTSTAISLSSITNSTSTYDITDAFNAFGNITINNNNNNINDKFETTFNDNFLDDNDDDLFANKINNQKITTTNDLFKENNNNNIFINNNDNNNDIDAFINKTIIINNNNNNNIIDNFAKFDAAFHKPNINFNTFDDDNNDIDGDNVVKSSSTSSSVVKTINNNNNNVTFHNINNNINLAKLKNNDKKEKKLDKKLTLNMNTNVGVTTNTTTANTKNVAATDVASSNLQKPTKFTDDYSKLDDFDVDLENVLKRSLFEK